jgi:uncharacterized protein DUF4038/collagenase-like protein with putative collagen-binding domain
MASRPAEPARMSNPSRLSLAAGLVLALLSAAPPARAQAVAFPLKVSPNGRYLVDQAGRPFRIHGDAGWDVAQKVTLAELRAYLDDRRAKGFNTILTYWGASIDYVVENTTCPGALGASGARPFLRDTAGNPWNGALATPDFSTPNEAYFAWIDTVVAEAAARNLLVLFGALYLGYDNGGIDGWMQALNNGANTQAVSFGFGQFLGNRYRNAANVIWYMGGDNSIPGVGSETEARALKVLQGVKAAGAAQLWTAHYIHDYLSTDAATFAPFMDLEHVYTHGPYPTLGPTYPLARLGYQHAPALPAFLLETTYEGDHGSTPLEIREYMWGASLSAIGGVVFGNGVLWKFDTAQSPGWVAALDSTGARDMQRLGALLDPLPWYRLVPSGLDGMTTLVTAGGGTYGSWSHGGSVGGHDYVVAAADAQGAALVAYVPDTHAGSLTVAMGALAAPSSARWYDPTTGASTAVAGAPFPNAGTHVFTPPAAPHADGSHDWVLVIETNPTPVELLGFRVQ